MTEEQEEEQNLSPEERARRQVKAVYDDGKATINDREYVLARMTHKQRRKVFAFFSRIQNDLNRGDFWWLESSEFADVESIINSHALYDGEKIANLDTHWELYPQDYMMFVTTMLGAMSYPFLSGVHTN